MQNMVNELAVIIGNKFSSERNINSENYQLNINRDFSYNNFGTKNTAFNKQRYEDIIPFGQRKNYQKEKPVKINKLDINDGF
ncbi:hypothetical protein [Pigmentibacter ruber]|uniref:hypothetical protein n=1 Tax=Pigmentibacter ruber TaxID=2683196 RepID=UPI00131E5C19|nr:hypothetical protein [Pigmentibacter ruber]BFD32207.1 hypothetical protein GTC16762_18250 [Pigmentibacter ruber]